MIATADRRRPPRAMRRDLKGGSDTRLKRPHAAAPMPVPLSVSLNSLCLACSAQRVGVAIDLQPGDPQAVVPPGLTLLQIDAEEQLPELIKTQDISRQLIR